MSGTEIAITVGAFGAGLAIGIAIATYIFNRGMH